ncbi:MAG TPA: DUF2892 domain-containing protein [Anaerolineales bacterium]|nr:DUF2892 domain-containing protein [Anaerolineales bacterium]
MKVNQANWERSVRVLLGVALLYAGFGRMVTGTWGIVAEIVGALALLTGLSGWCPIYALLKFSTKKA